MLYVLKILKFEIKSKVELWNLKIDERNIYLERLKCLSETLVVNLRVVIFCYDCIWIPWLKFMRYNCSFTN